MRGAFIKKTRISPMRTDGSFHGLFTLAPLPTAWFWCAVGATDCHGFFRMRKVRCGAKNLEIWGICGRQLSAQCAKEQAECIYSPTDRADKHRYHAGCFYQKNTDITDAHGWVFSRIVYSCSAAYRLVLMRRRRNGLPRIFFACGRCAAERKICGNPRDLWATTKRTMR